MAYYKVCPVCGCNLDPGETCDCADEEFEAEPAVKGINVSETEKLCLTA